MTVTLKTKPEGVRLNPLSERVFEVLARYTSFPWPVMQAQCKRVDANPEALTPADLKRAAEHIATGVARFTSPQNGEKVLDELMKLAR